jgi:hypothetical protein
MSDFLCPYCGEIWCHHDESIRYHNSGKSIPLDENNNRHDFRDCPKSAFNLKKGSKIRAVAYKKSEIKKIDDSALLADISEKIRHWNSRLANYVLDLHVNRKNPEGEEV